MSRTLSNLLTSFVRGALTPLKDRRRDIVSAMISRNLIPQPEVLTRHGVLRFHCPDKEALEYPRDLLTREPGTVKWIDGFKKGDVFWDIGANVGAYSLYAALVTEAPVLAFEPAAATFALLVKNVEINRLDGIVQPYCLALSDRTVLDTLNMAHTYASSVMHAFGTETTATGERVEVRFRQAVPGFRIDDFVRLFRPPLPNHIKLDVDSIEPQIIEGGPDLLSNTEVRSILVEVESAENTARTNRIIDGLNRAGLEPTGDGRTDGSGNMVFWRRGIEHGATAAED